MDQILPHPSGPQIFEPYVKDAREEELERRLQEHHLIAAGPQEVINALFTARHNIVAHIVDSHPVLAQNGGVAAVLSRAEPWEPATVVKKASTLP